MKHDLKDVLSPRDKGILDATTGSSWVPNQPADVLLPYVDESVQEPEENSVEDRRKKAQKIYDDYGKLIKTCQNTREQIANRCKHVTVDLKGDNNLAIMEAVRRVFGTDGTKITFQMYQRCIDELAKRSNNSIPKPGGK